MSSKCRDFSGPCFPVFGLNTGKYGPEKAPYLDTFHAVMGTNFRSNPFFKLLKDYLIFYNKETGVRSLADDITDDILMFMKLYRDDSGTIC